MGKEVNPMKQQKEGNWIRRHKILTAILGIFLLVIIVNAAGGGSDSDNDGAGSTGAKSETKQEDTKQSSKIGEPARDGKFEFTVNSISCGETTVGTNEYLQDKATGHFCRLNLAIKNIGDEAQSLFADNQKLIDDQGRQYSYDSTATIYASPNDSGSTWFDQINPGNSVVGDILFDVPADASIVTAELHDSAFSGGVKVQLQ